MNAHLDVLRREAAALAAAARRDLTAHVPSCPEWDVHRLVHHTGGAYAWVTEIVTTCAQSAVDEPDAAQAPPEGVLEWYDARLAALLDAITEAGPDPAVWNWSERDFAVSWWARRMANETAVHRWDAELAAGAPAPLRDDVAVDSIDELLTVFLPSGLRRRPEEGLAGTFEITCTDTGDAWHGDLRPDGVDVRRGPANGTADATLRGPASDLALAMWGRDVAVEVAGDSRITGLLTE